jgi:hypothetical protein
MGIVLLILVVALACFAGWLAHIIEKWLQNRPRDDDRSKVSQQLWQPSSQTNYHASPRSSHDVSAHEKANTPKPQLETVPPSEDYPAHLSSPQYQPAGVEARFENWQGTGIDKYPPDWKFRSAEVRKRDGDRCQVAGCPNIGLRHVHHLDSIKNGGNHALSNLITLCEFHHALMPDHLEAIGQNLEDSRFSVRRKGIRSNPVNPGFHNVKAGIVRRQPASKQEIIQLLSASQRSWSCPHCDCHDLVCDEKQGPDWARFNRLGKAIDCKWRLICQECGCAWYFQGGLLEEIGLILGRLLYLRSNPKLTQYEESWLEELQFIEATACPRTDCLGHLVWRFNKNDGSLFQGCTEWKSHR